jgi:hypothetical protein
MTVNPVFLAMQKICSTKRVTNAKLMKKWSKITISSYHASWLFFGTIYIYIYAKNNPRKNEIKSLFLASKKS